MQDLSFHSPVNSMTSNRSCPTYHEKQCNMHRAELGFEQHHQSTPIYWHPMIHCCAMSDRFRRRRKIIFCRWSSALLEADRSIAHIWIIILQAHSIGKGPFAHWLQYYRLKVLPIIKPIKSRQSKSGGIMQRPIDRGLICLYVANCDRSSIVPLTQNMEASTIFSGQC
jgi:hypothetical protein